MCWRLGDIEAKVVYYSSLGRKVRPLRHGKNLMHLYCGCTIQPPVGDGLRELGLVFAPHGRACSRLLLLKDWLSVDE
jgi:hypothetical protein